jgi:chromosome partitioning protein
MEQKIVAVVNQKGGVGKTTTTINVAAHLASLGQRIVLLDLDPQGNATSGLGISKDGADVTTYDILCGGAPISSAILETNVAQLSVIPSNADLAGAEVELVSVSNREFSLKRAIEKIDYDYVFIDCPPSLGLLTINALTAANLVLIPVQAEYYA